MTLFTTYRLLSFRFTFFLRQFPILVRQRSVTTKKTPGTRIIHQELVISAFSANESILPHEITSNGSPIPIKLSVDSDMIALLTFIITINMIEETKFGVRCFQRIWKKLPPIHLEAMTYSLFRICLTSVRTTFAILVQLVIPITTERLTIFAYPIIA